RRRPSHLVGPPARDSGFRRLWTAGAVPQGGALAAGLPRGHGGEQGREQADGAGRQDKHRQVPPPGANPAIASLARPTMEAAIPSTRSTGDQDPRGPSPAGRRSIGRCARMTAMTTSTSTAVRRANQAGGHRGRTPLPTYQRAVLPGEAPLVHRGPHEQAVGENQGSLLHS